MISFINLSHRVERVAFRTMRVSAGRRRIGCARVRARSHRPVSHEARTNPHHPCHQCTIHFKNFGPPSFSLSLFFARIHSFHFQLEIILIWCMANATKRVRRYPLNSFLVPFPSSFQRFSPLPTPQTRQPVTRSTGICAVGYYALPCFNLYPLGGISWKRTEVE